MKLLLYAFPIMLPVLASAQSPYLEIKSRLKALGPLPGSWTVGTEMTSRDGKITRETGSYEIFWALDSTYLQWTAKLTNTLNGRSRQFICWLTYDIEKSMYRKIYIYDKTSFMVIEYGNYDLVNKTLHTNTILNLPQGEEHIRTECIQLNPNHFEYKGWARFGNEEEFNDFNATMFRK